MSTELPFWLQNARIFGNDGEEQPPGDQEEHEEEEGEEEEEEGEENPPGSSDSDLENLKKALAEERKARKTAEREAKKLKRKEDSATKQEAEDLEATKENLRLATERTAKLASRLKNNEVTSAIINEARAQGFIDPTDALTDDVRKAIDADQDEDDPSDIDIDADSVKLAVKKLADRKKHLLGTPNEGAPSGSRRKKKQGSETTDEAKLKELYPGIA